MKSATQLRDDALERVEDNANKDWTNLVLQIIRELAAVSEKITSDDVWVELKKYPNVQTHQPSAMGAMFRRAVSLELIETSDNFILSSRPSSHARPIRVWRSIVLKGQ